MDVEALEDRLLFAQRLICICGTESINLRCVWLQAKWKRGKVWVPLQCTRLIRKVGVVMLHIQGHGSHFSQHLLQLTVRVSGEMQPEPRCFVVTELSFGMLHNALDVALRPAVTRFRHE